METLVVSRSEKGGRKKTTISGRFHPFIGHKGP
jgi:hypothetical protein